MIKKEFLLQRNQHIKVLYLQGYTLQQIGDAYALSRERVRQILEKLDVNPSDGGIAVMRRIIKPAKDLESKDRKCKVLYGSTVRETDGIPREAKRAYMSQKNNARHRGLSWALSLVEWWGIWQRSGKWLLRGLGVGKYVMCRLDHHRGYETRNVTIGSQSENSKFKEVFAPKTKTKRGRRSRAQILATIVPLKGK